MARAWIVDGRGIATKVKNASVSSASQIKDCGAYIDCPNCTYRIDNSNVVVPWPGLPKGVKFEPTDEDVIEFLEAKCGIGGSDPHVLIEEFIRPVTEDVGINYTHPKNLPGANKDGVSVFFFHKTVQAYGTGQRKRRKITPTCLDEEPVRWHKTGRTKSVSLNGVQRGCKKIMVLYKSARKGSKPEKSNWVLHQYHLGTEGEEIGDYVVSKITYQQDKFVEVLNEGESSGVRGGPRTPKMYTPQPPTPVTSLAGDEEEAFDPFGEGLENIPGAVLEKMWSKKARMEDDYVVNLNKDNLTCSESFGTSSAWENQVLLPNHNLGTPKMNTPQPPTPVNSLVGDDEAFDPFGEGLDNVLEKTEARMEDHYVVNLNDDNLTCNESIEASTVWENQVLLPNPNLGTIGEFDGFSIADLENADLGTPPDLLSLPSQESLLNWIGWQ